MATNNTTGAFPNADLSLAVTAGVYHDIQHFLFREALLLDHRRFDEWTALLANDVVFRMPAGFAREIGIDTPAGLEYFHDDRRAIGARLKRLHDRCEPPGAQQPCATQTLRFIANVIVCPCDRDEYNVLSYVLLTVVKTGEAQSTVFSAERYDRLRRSSRSFKIVRREIVMDQRNANVDIDMYL
jgi:3-phenylpropionate/cinnamic acid dioxygenase small subunit